MGPGVGLWRAHGRLTCRRALGVFCVVSCLRVRSFNTVQSLETTLVEKKLADVALGTLYAVFTIAAIIAPRIVDLIGTSCFQPLAVT